MPRLHAQGTATTAQEQDEKEAVEASAAATAYAGSDESRWRYDPKNVQFCDPLGNAH